MRKTCLIHAGLTVLALSLSSACAPVPAVAGPPSIRSISVQALGLSAASAAATVPGAPAGVDVMVMVTVANFEPVAATGQGSAAGQGHLIYYLDNVPDALPDMPAWDSGVRVMSTSTSYTWRGVAPGPHLFAVQLVNNDDSAFSPPAAAAAVLVVPPASGGAATGTTTAGTATGTAPGGGLVIQSDSIVRARVVAVRPQTSGYPWEADVLVLSSQSVGDLPNPTADKVGQVITVRSSEDLSGIGPGTDITARVKYAGDVPLPGIVLLIYDIAVAGAPATATATAATAVVLPATLVRPPTDSFVVITGALTAGAPPRGATGPALLSYLPAGALVLHWANGITEAFYADGVRLFIARDSEAAPVTAPGAGTLPATKVLNLPSGAVIDAGPTLNSQAIYASPAKDVLLLTVVTIPADYYGPPPATP